METAYLRTLCLVLETGSFSRTADEMNLTQSAVSQRVKFLEQQYGTPLVNRGGPVVSATEAGQMVATKARQILNLEKELQEGLKSLGKKSRIALSCTPTFGIVYLPRVLNRFFLAHSDDVDFKSALNPPELSLKAVLSNDFDIAVIEHCRQLKAEDAVILQLPEDELVFISAPSLGIQEQEVPLQLLTAHRLVARKEGCSSRVLLQENLALYGRSMDDFRSTIIHDDLYLAIQTVASGRGVAFVSRSLVAEYLRRGELREHSVPGFRCSRLRTVVINRRRSEDPLMLDFIESIRSAFDTAPPAEFPS